ncbi:MAG TPA: helix-turn-helix domain-containing protein [Chryseolinea sp.]
METVPEPSMDARFLQKVNQIIADNLGNEHFTVDILSSEAGLSRSMLHRKLVKITGKSASDLIQETRLQRALQLLEAGAATVSEVAYRVGFNSPSYFNKVFQKYYGVSPGEVRKGIKVVVAHKPATLRKRPVAIAIVIVLLAGFSSGLIYYLYSLRGEETQERSLAVLPLQNLTGQGDNDYFVDGIHDALISELGKINSIRVISRTSTLRYQNSGMLLKDIANELGVAGIVEGSVSKASDSLRIIIQLIEVFPKERHLWTQEYRDKMNNVLSIQNTVIRNIADKIKVNLSADEEARFTFARTTNPEIYKSYLRGMHHLNKGTAESFETGIQYFHKAVEIDPADPFANAALALGYAAYGHGQLSSEENFNRSFAAATRAISLDSTMDKAHTALGLLYLYQSWNWEKAKQSFERALIANPNNEFAHAHYAWYHVLFGDKEKALHHAHRAVAIDPFSPDYHSWLALLYYRFSEFEAAETYAQKTLALEKNSPYGNLVMGWIALRQGMPADAVKYHDNLPPTGDMWKMCRAHTYVMTGNRAKALALWTEWDTQAEIAKINPFHMGLMAGYLGFTDRSFELLNAACDQKIYPVTYIECFPSVASLHDDDRYDMLMKKMNLPVKRKELANN